MDLSKLSIPPSVKAELPNVMRMFGINTPLRLAHFLAQCAHESMGFKVVYENLNYSEIGLLNTFKKYFTPEQAKQYARKPQAIANRVYANRMGNGNEASGDGWKHRGRGFKQLTGKANYALFDKAVPDDIINNPDLVATKYPLLSAAWFWSVKGLNAIADRDDLKKVTLVVNGGLNGLDKRQIWLIKFKKELGII